jgi:hypothetical protein
LKILLLNQTFHPDVAATAQYLAQLACGLAERGHDVTVVASRRAYDEPQRRFPAQESWRGIRIFRVPSTTFGKGARWRRAVDFASFLLSCAVRLAALPKPDVVVALTSPPLISFFGACLARLSGSRFVYWVMDFNPDEAIAAGWLRPGSPPARLVEWLSRYSLQHAHRIIALDHFMRDRIVAKGIPAGKVVVLPPWSQDDQVRYEPTGREQFRARHGLAGKFVVMHSGNHSPIHPLQTLLEAAGRLTEEREVVFCFVGGGSEFRRVQKLASQRSNVFCLPYQPAEQLSASLSAADVHVVVMGNAFVGLVHPCKIYNILSVGAPVLYLGPRPSHISEILELSDAAYPCAQATHGDVESLVQGIKRLHQLSGQLKRHTLAQSRLQFSRQVLLPRLIAELEAE